MSFIVLHLNISIYNSILMNTIYKRLREKVFTEKRQPYKSYLKATWKWSDIFNEITNLKLTKLLLIIKNIEEDIINFLITTMNLIYLIISKIFL